MYGFWKVRDPESNKLDTIFSYGLHMCHASERKFSMSIMDGENLTSEWRRERPDSVNDGKMACVNQGTQNETGAHNGFQSSNFFLLRYYASSSSSPSLILGFSSRASTRDCTGRSSRRCICACWAGSVFSPHNSLHHFT